MPTPHDEAEALPPDPVHPPSGTAPVGRPAHGWPARAVVVVAIGVLVVGVVATLAVTQNGGDADGDIPNRDADGDEAAAEAPTTTTDMSAGTTLAEPGTPMEPACPPEDGPSELVRSFTEPPPMCIDPDRTYVATVETTRGEFEISLDPGSAPETVNNFVFLARWRFYEGAGFFPGRSRVGDHGR